MSHSYRICCSSTVDLSPDWLEKRQVAYAYFNYFLDSVPYKDDFGQTHNPHELYAKILAGAAPSTSQLSVGDYLELWQPLLAAGQDILHVCLSSGISGTYQSALQAADLAREQFSDRSIYVLDSLSASSGYGLFLDTLCDLRDEGMGLEKLYQWGEEHRLNVHNWFFSSDLSFFIRGGRISKAAGLAGSMLKICPVMQVERDGSLGIKEKIRTKAKAEKRIAQLFDELHGEDFESKKIFISNSDCLDDAKEVEKLIIKKYPQLEGHIYHFDIGATIGCHTGPGTVAVFWWGKDRL